MKTIAVSYDKPNTFLHLISLNKTMQIKDDWGIPFDVDAFRIEEVKKSRKSVEFCYYKKQMPYFRAIKKPKFEDIETKEEGDITIRIGKDKYKIGEWRTA